MPRYQNATMRYNPYNNMGAPSMYGGYNLLPIKQFTGTKYNYGGPGSRTVSKRRRGKRQSGLKQTIRGLESALHNVSNATGTANFVTSHNNVYSKNLTYDVTQGTAQGNRQGDTIYLCALRLSGFYESPISDANGIIYRIIVYWSDVYAATGNWGTATITTGNLFINSGDRNSTLITDPKKITVLYDETTVIQPSIAQVYTAMDIATKVSIEKAINFLPGANEVNPRQLYISIIPSVANGTAGITDTGKFIMGTDLIFKNSK